MLENPKYQRFPSQIVPESAHSPRWQGLRTSAYGADVRVRMQSRPYFVSDLSGCLCTDKIKEYIFAMLWRNGGSGLPVLNVVSPFCEIGIIAGRANTGETIVQPQVLGNTSGGRTFQLKKRLLVPGYESEEVYYTVTKPNYNYPPLEGLGATKAGVVSVQLLDELKLYANGVPLASGLWACNRDTGLVTVAGSVNGSIGATGGFYILMLLPNEIPMKHKGNGIWEISSNVRLEEPFGGA